MTLSRRDYARTMANPKRSEAAQKGAWKRTMNERRIDGLLKRVRELEARVQELEALAAQEGA
jgi:hypothetical protein